MLLIFLFQNLKRFFFPSIFRSSTLTTTFEITDVTTIYQCIAMALWRLQTDIRLESGAIIISIKQPLIMIQRYSIFLLMRLIAKRSTISLYLAVPIVAYHSIDNNKTSDSTDIELFARKWNTYMIMVFRIGISWGLIHQSFGYDLYQKVDCVIFFF